MSDKHVVIDASLQAFVCKHCRSIVPLALPMSMAVLGDQTVMFIAAHRDCTKDDGPEDKSEPPKPHPSEGHD